MKPRVSNAPVAVPSPSPAADVCFLLEGTYPYVPGGVSSWVDQLIRGMPDIKFALFYMGSQKALTPKPHYKLHSNIVAFEEVYLYDRLEPARNVPGRPTIAWQQRFYLALHSFYNAPDDAARMQRFWDVTDLLHEAGPRYTFGNLCHDLPAWEIQLQTYERFAANESFIDFFWTTRFLHLPLFRLLETRNRIPQARIYHAVTTGYAGLMGALAARTQHAPYLITEHGIYTNERLAEISRADWIYEANNTLFTYSEGLSTFKRIWVEFFFFLARIAYQEADKILTLYQGNARMQIAYGANPEKIEILPNGIDPSRFDQALARRHERLRQGTPQTLTIGFIGRVVSIKDVKTLLRAARITTERGSSMLYKIIGPTGEEPDYFHECRAMVAELGLENVVVFLGNQNIIELLHEIDVVVLTSSSEGLPLVILEGFAAGIPLVATDVGACRELVHGRTQADQALGPAGIITRVSAPGETADALLHFVQNPEALRVMGLAGRRRTEDYYTQKALLERYHQLYSDHSWSERRANRTASSPAASWQA